MDTVTEAYAVWATIVVAAYMLGAVPTGLMVGRWTKGVDIRLHGSGNIGATNAFRVMGRGPSLVILLVDIAKAALPVVVARLIGVPSLVAALAGVAAVAGHCWPVYIGFRGGKGVACALGAGLAMFWVAGLAGVAVAAVVMWLTRYASLGSLAGTAAGTVVVLIAISFGWLPLGCAAFAVATAVVFYRHRDNLRRLRDGTERKLGQRVFPNRKLGATGGA